MRTPRLGVSLREQGGCLVVERIAELSPGRPPAPGIPQEDLRNLLARATERWNLCSAQHSQCSLVLLNWGGRMILVHLSQTWPLVLDGKLTPAAATLGNWYGINDAAIAEYGDGLLGIYDNEVVTAFDIAPGTAARDTEARVTFQGNPSHTWAHLIGTPNPGKPWGVRGMARPIQYMHTATLQGGTVEPEENGTSRRAVIDEFTLAVDEHGAAVLSIPAGSKLTIVTRAA
jgi:hypothetical protein